MTRPPGDSASRPSALLVCPEPPYPLRGGGALRTASILNYLVTRYSVDVVLFRQPGQPDPSEALPLGLVRNSAVFDLPYHSKDPLSRAMRNLRRYLAGSAPLTDRFQGFAGPLEKFLRGRQYETAVVEHSWCAPYLEQIALHSNRTILDLHNIESVLHRRCELTEPWPASELHRRFHSAALAAESRWLEQYALLLTASEPDAAEVIRIAPHSRVKVVPNTIPCRETPDTREEEVLVFSGNLEYHPNVAAIRFFKNKIWPGLHRKWPRLRWRILGGNGHAIRGVVAGDSSIEVRAPGDDAVKAIAAARVVVAPLLAGSGTRVKIIEAWAAGRPVVSTPIGAEGLGARHGEELLLSEDAGAFADSVSQLLENGELRTRIASAGRRLYERSFTWQAAWDKLHSLGI